MDVPVLSEEQELIYINYASSGCSLEDLPEPIDDIYIYIYIYIYRERERERERESRKSVLSVRLDADDDDDNLVCFSQKKKIILLQRLWQSL